MGFVAGVGMQNLQKGCVREVSIGGMRDWTSDADWRRLL